MKKITALLAITALACICAGCQAKVRQYKVHVVKEYNHDRGAYTQGLFFNGGKFYESTGQFGQSSFRIVDLPTGKVQRRLDFARKYFGEGSVILGDRIYMLTWTNRVAFIYDASTLEFIQAYSYPREGWGLTTDGKSLIASDGSSNIYFLTPEFQLERSINVMLNGRPQKYLNELEWIDGKIWANIYTTDIIVIINPSSGEVEATVDCSGLLPRELRRPDTDVLNGIAYDPDTKKIYLTGKNWPRLYEVRLEKL